MAQPLWVQEQMGDNVKDEARFMTDTFVKWLRSPSDDIFWKTASWLWTYSPWSRMGALTPG